MQENLGKHRLYLHRPSSIMVQIFALSGAVSPALFREKLSKAMNRHEYFRTRVVETRDGDAFYEEIAEAVVSLEIEEFEPAESDDEESMVDIAFEWAEEAVQYPMAIQRGELMKHRLFTDGETMAWAVASHYLAGDAYSILYLARDVFRALDQPQYKLDLLAWKPLDISKLPDDSNLFFTARRKVKKLNQTWQKDKRSFTPNDRERMTKNFHEAFPMKFYHTELDQETVLALRELADREGLRFTSLIGAAYYMASAEKDNLHITVSTREAGNEGAGIYQGGIQLDYPKMAMDTLGMAKKISAKMDELLNRPTAVHHSASVLLGLEGTLIDAGYYAAFDALDNASAKTIRSMYGLSGQGRGMQISNLKNCFEDEDYAFATIDNIYLMPPFINNFARMIGVVSVQNRMSITHAAFYDKEYEQIILLRAKEQLEKLIK